MNPVKTVFTTRVLGEEQGYIPLPVCDAVTQHGQTMFTFWKPEPEELQALIDGCFIRLQILGSGHPPVALDVYPDILQQITEKVS